METKTVDVAGWKNVWERPGIAAGGSSDSGPSETGGDTPGGGAPSSTTSATRSARSTPLRKNARDQRAWLNHAKNRRLTVGISALSLDTPCVRMTQTSFSPVGNST